MGHVSIISKEGEVIRSYLKHNDEGFAPIGIPLIAESKLKRARESKERLYQDHIRSRESRGLKRLLAGVSFNLRLLKATIGEEDYSREPYMLICHYESDILVAAAEILPGRHIINGVEHFNPRRPLLEKITIPNGTAREVDIKNKVYIINHH